MALGIHHGLSPTDRAAERGAGGHPETTGAAERAARPRRGPTSSESMSLERTIWRAAAASVGAVLLLVLATLALVVVFTRAEHARTRTLLTAEIRAESP